MPSAAANGNKLETIVLQLKWLHAYQFAGYYAAQALGYYKDAGLDVVFREGGPAIDPVEEVSNGRADYGVSGVDILTAHSMGRPVIAIGAIFQHSAEVLLVRDDEKIPHLSDLKGKRVMFTNEGTPSIKTMLFKTLGTLDSITILDHDGDFSKLIDGRVDALSAYYTDEPRYFQARNLPVKMFRPIDYGLDFYGDILFTSSQEASLHQQRLDKFWEASLRGWAFAMHNPEKMLPIIREYTKRFNDDELTAEYRIMLETVQPHYIPLGNMSLSRWQSIGEAMKTAGQLPKNYDISEAFYRPNLTLPDIDYQHLLIVNIVLATVFISVILYLLLINRRLKEAMKKRRQAENSTAQLGAILEHSLNEIYIFDADTLRFINVNESARRNLGYSMAELALMTPSDIKDDYHEMLLLSEYIEPILAQRVSSKLFSTRHFRKDGSSYPVEVHLQRGYYQDRAVFIALILDISDRVAAETRYQQEKALLRIVIDNIPDLIFIKDKQSVYLGCNKAFAQYFGAEEQDIIGKTDFDFMPHELAELSRQRDQETLASDKISENEEWVTYPDGREALLDTLKTPYFGVDQEILGVIGVSRDITNMRIIENARHAALLRFEAIFNYAPQVAIQGFLRDGTVLHWNHANELLYGYSAEQAISQKVQNLLLAPNEHREFLQEIEAIWRCFAEDMKCPLDDHSCKPNQGCLVTKSKERCFRHKNGRTVWVYRAMFPIIEDGQITEIFCMDVEISDLKHIEMELRELNEQLELCVEREVEISRQKDLALIQQARFAALGEMIGNIAHQWRQPLNSLSLLMANLREACRGCDSHAEIVQNTYTESYRLIRAMSQTITDFSNFFKSGREEQPFYPMDGVTHAVSMIMPVLDHAEIALVIEDITTAKVHGIYNEFVQVIMNLITNAKDAILEHRDSDRRIVISLDENEEYVLLAIKDNGGGIADQIVEKIFDPYFTTKPQGTGIGLSMVKMLVERANGTIYCRNDQDGAVFTVSLPRLSDTQVQQPESVVA